MSLASSAFTRNGSAYGGDAVHTSSRARAASSAVSGAGCRRRLWAAALTTDIVASLGTAQIRAFSSQALAQLSDAAVQALSKLKSKPDQARAVIQIGIIIGGADGNFDSDEKQVVREACFAVGINPAEFDLG